MNNDKKNNLGHEALILIGCIMLLAFICRLWPILLLMLLAVFAAAMIACFDLPRGVDMTDVVFEMIFEQLFWGGPAFVTYAVSGGK